ncbi:MAG: 4-diphosphocytidyl-2C-methyl-D-erythritol kinase [Actinomycetia bacterium]|nr:4-diphosphocytidyl-2C-methyl-D-erythritol kinase [Actinomycetes bacterium]
MVGWARAKVTLALDVLGPAADGFHPVDIVLHRIPLGDHVRLAPASVERLAMDGSPMGPDNLCRRALDVVREVVGELPPVDLSVRKRIPVGAGLGGGSADAAFVLGWAARRHPDRREALRAAAIRLGMDVPFLLLEREAARATGRGERLEPLPALPRGWLVLAYPGWPLSTAAVYAAYDRIGSPDPPRAGAVVDALRRGVLPSELGNQLEAAAWAVAPALADFRRRLERAGAPRRRTTLTGSGSTYVVLFDDPDAARALAERLAADQVPWVRCLAMGEAGGRAGKGADG